MHIKHSVYVIDCSSNYGNINYMRARRREQQILPGKARKASLRRQILKGKWGCGGQALGRRAFRSAEGTPWELSSHVPTGQINASFGSLISSSLKALEYVGLA